jgi:hypothetical protein
MSSEGVFSRGAAGVSLRNSPGVRRICNFGAAFFCLVKGPIQKEMRTIADQSAEEEMSFLLKYKIS